MSAWFRELGLAEEPAVQVAGPGLTVVIWSAGGPGPRRGDRHRCGAEGRGMRRSATARLRPMSLRSGRPCRRSSCRSRSSRPRPPRREARLWRNLELFAAARPRFISVTCGAGGTGQRRHLPAGARRSRSGFGMPAAAHLTCACASRDGDRRASPGATGMPASAGSWRCAATRPRAASRYRPHADGYAYASDLIAGLRRIADFEINAACYPEVHPEAAERACRPREPEAQGRGRGHAR